MRRHSFPGCEQEVPQEAGEELLLAIPITYQFVMKGVELVLRNGRTVTEYQSVMVPVLAPIELLTDYGDEGEEVPF
jgi:hypothetical protein